MEITFATKKLESAFATEKQRVREFGAAITAITILEVTDYHGD